jgi:hypothetical protein
MRRKLSKKVEEDEQPEALATFAAAARNKGMKPASQGVSATPQTVGNPGARLAANMGQRSAYPSSQTNFGEAVPKRASSQRVHQQASLTTSRFSFRVILEEIFRSYV